MVSKTTICANIDKSEDIRLKCLGQNDVLNTIYQKAVQMEMAVLPIARPTLDSDHTFSELEGNRFTELLFATKCMKNELKTMYTSEVFSVDDYFVTLDQKCEQEVRKLIKSYKSLICFNEICEQDRNKLIKTQSVQIYKLRSVAYFDEFNECWNVELVH
ncbi:unnamed protein product [Oppiella nova]|uniref:Uncharacterized protein n=1 Tax=Oppiella nova TaxID=334625 RepID=A0A7R9LDN3_9ACAR|nr:unnamed protein product [Oppiella nova]CAG2162421.1 unnamed protein product [Oppiella nova]